MNLNLKNKVIIVTGGAKGIGEGVIKVLANEKAIPVIIGRNNTDNQKTLNEIGGNGFQVVAELSNPEDCKMTIEKVIEKYGKIDGLVNNAGVNDSIGLENGNYDAFVKSLHSNLIHYYLMAQYALPYLKISKGTIVNIGSKLRKLVKVARRLMQLPMADEML